MEIVSVQQYQSEKRRDYEAAASPFPEPRRSEREGTMRNYNAQREVLVRIA
jgi:hypothetical protein